MESLRKAQQQFVLMKLPPLGSAFGQVSRQASTFLGDGDFEMEEYEGIPRTPRGSSRASRVSSLAHSHRFVVANLLSIKIKIVQFRRTLPLGQSIFTGTLNLTLVS